MGSCTSTPTKQEEMKCTKKMKAGAHASVMLVAREIADRVCDKDRINVLALIRTEMVDDLDSRVGNISHKTHKLINRDAVLGKMVNDQVREICDHELFRASTKLGEMLRMVVREIASVACALAKIELTSNPSIGMYKECTTAIDTLQRAVSNYVRCKADPEESAKPAADMAASAATAGGAAPRVITVAPLPAGVEPKWETDDVLDSFAHKVHGEAARESGGFGSGSAAAAAGMGGMFA
jgi:hypothetical protein